MWSRIIKMYCLFLVVFTGVINVGSATTLKTSGHSLQQTQLKTNGQIPSKVFEILKYIQKNGRPKDGYVGGRRFGNYEKILPKYESSGKKIEYQEWDVNPKIEGKNRGKERLVTGSDGKAYYTDDHYQSFTLVPNQSKK